MTDAEKLAADIFARAVARASGLETLDKEERRTALKQAASICFDAAAAFMEVKHEKSC